ncbi:LPS export ABC transporter permease LptF [Roseateles puraquae]|jgi:lipopolysaccharide export system permease protein|uniref:Lipopolysaccharide export system permease protein LptF n=1 Tax=Roseateles puraquae TaxID=431059 RepID=A0A254NCX8_9BURK|nr:LPS export ABC transporter permease LptF [Roseateles puraquae]MDG0854207.1 LPS export ABC transporter permease LptF [Roseateles puraquae]OWR05504.1 LPS export ABC transporter permease LptF [Roseateles puraquae]
MLFDSSTRSELARSFGVTLVVILTIMLTVTLIKTLGQAAGGNVAPQDVVLLMGYATLAHLATMLNLSLFIAVVATLGRRYRESEMTIWFASGVPLSRFIRPVLRMAWPILLAIVVLELVVWPWGNQNSAELRDRYQKRSDLSRVAPGQFQTSRDGSRVFFIERDGDDAGTGRNVFILSNQNDRESVTTSARGRLEMEGDDRMLVLDHGQRNETQLKTGEKSLARFEQYKVMTDTQVLANANQLPPKATPTLDLLRNLTVKNQGEIAWRLGWIFAGFNMALLGIGVAASNPRRANNWNLLFALLAFVVYFNSINVSVSRVGNGTAALAPTLLGLHGGAFVLALTLIWLRDNGNRFCLRRRAKEATA